jgi:hypothetical protein
MKEYLDSINDILFQGGQIKTYEGLDSSFHLKDSALEEEIKECDVYFKERLPAEYKFFLKNYNGGVLFQVEDIGGFKFLGAKELVKEDLFQRSNFQEDWDDSVIVFCHCLGDAEYLGFKILENSKYQILHCMMYEFPSEWQVIGDSFDGLVLQLIKERGKKYWFFIN